MPPKMLLKSPWWIGVCGRLFTNKTTEYHTKGAKTYSNQTELLRNIVEHNQPCQMLIDRQYRLHNTQKQIVSNETSLIQYAIYNCPMQ